MLCSVLPFAQTTCQRNRRFMHHSRYHPSLHDALTDFSRNMLACFQLPGTSKTRTDTNTPHSCLVCVVTRRSASKMLSTGKKGGQSATNGRQMARTSARETTSTLTTSRATSFCTCALSRREHFGLHSRCQSPPNSRPPKIPVNPTKSFSPRGVAQVDAEQYADGLIFRIDNENMPLDSIGGILASSSDRRWKFPPFSAPDTCFFGGGSCVGVTTKWATLVPVDSCVLRPQKGFRGTEPWVPHSTNIRADSSLHLWFSPPFEWIMSS